MFGSELEAARYAAAGAENTAAFQQASGPANNDSGWALQKKAHGVNAEMCLDIGWYF